MPLEDCFLFFDALLRRFGIAAKLSKPEGRNKGHGGTEMFADKLKKLRKEKHLTQGELAAFLGISTSAVGMYEQNRRSPSISDVSAIAKFFGVTTDYLLDSQSDEREVGELINELKNRLLCADGLMFNGEALTESELKQLSDAIEVSAAVVLSRKERKSNEQN